MRVALILVFQPKVAPALLTFLHRLGDRIDIVKAIFVPEGDHAKLLTPSSLLVRLSASPPATEMR